MMSKNNSGKRKRNVNQSDYGTKCVCCDPKCDAAMAKLLKYNEKRHVYFTLPKEPQKTKVKPRPDAAEKRARKSLKRQRFLKALPRDATTRANDERYNASTKMVFASLHVHDKIFDLCQRDERGHLLLVDSIPASMARELSRYHGCTFTSTDKFSDNTYAPLPNVRPQDFFDYANDLEKKALQAQASIQEANAIQTRNTSTSPEQVKNDRLNELLIRQKAQMKQNQEDIDNQKAEIEERRKELVRMRKEIVERQRDTRGNEIEVAEKLSILSAGDEIYGLTRSALISKTWHKNHPKAAKNLFGFKSWKELVCILHALFHVLPPTEIIVKDARTSRFEHYLMGYMRIHTGMTNFAISLIWGRDNGHVGRIINTAVHSIGSAGKDLSILDITPEYLEKTCPQQYKDEGLERCCAVPDGKDFMIYTTRKNTLFSRASYSDKVHHSAVRCISWSTPMGLSFEHTDCFLGRVSEKKLVELWGLRLKKCPIGWFMLSDRGFFDTARFYPNMNHQKTPKFLSGRDQFTEEEVSSDRRICKLRYTCEVAFSRVTKTRGLRDVISNDFFPILDDMNHWGHATVNLDAPLMKLN